MKRLSQTKHLLALAWLLLGWATAAAQSAATVSLAPAEPVLAAGETTTLTIQVAGASDLYGVELHLQYDPAVLQVLDADVNQAGVQLRPGDLLDPGAGFTVANRADNEAGALDYAITLLAPAEAVSGDGVLVSFDVRALADGSSELMLSVILASAEGESLPVTVEGGWLTVGSGPSTRPLPTPTTAGPRATSTPQPATPAQTPTATGAPPGQTPIRTPVARQPTPTTSQSTSVAGIPAPATSESPPAGQPADGDLTGNTQAGPDETQEAVAALDTSPAASEVETEDQAAAAGTADTRLSPDAVPIAPSASGSSAESGQDDNPAVAGGLVLAAFLLIALVIFFGRRLLRRKL